MITNQITISSRSIGNVVLGQLRNPRKITAIISTGSTASNPGENTKIGKRLSPHGVAAWGSRGTTNPAHALEIPIGEEAQTYPTTTALATSRRSKNNAKVDASKQDPKRALAFQSSWESATNACYNHNILNRPSI